MITKPIKTHKITTKDKNLFKILDDYLPSLKEGAVVAITSKIVAICQGRVADPQKCSRDELAAREADYYLPRSRHGFMLTIKNNTFIASAGIDESNANGLFILWPTNPQKTANEIRQHLKKKYHLKNIGVIITDSHLTPLRSGTTGVCLAHSGFAALHNYVGGKDLFGRTFKVQQANLADALAAAAVLVMGEGKEQTPLAVIEDISFVKFQLRDPTKKELNTLRIKMNEDLFAPLLKSVKWRKGKSK